MLSRRIFSKSIFTAPWILRAQQGALKARVKIDTERTIGDIDPKLYGNFIEHLGRCIYGGVFDETSSLFSNSGEEAIQSGGNETLMYLVVFLFLALRGAGALSFDALVEAKTGFGLTAPMPCEATKPTCTGSPGMVPLKQASQGDS